MPRMLDEMTVLLNQRNADGSTKRMRVSQYDFCQRQSLEIKRLLGEIENLIETTQDNKQRTEWPDNIKNKFMQIRHKMLDKANGIERQPSNLMHRETKVDSVEGSEWIAAMLNKTAE